MKKRVSTEVIQSGICRVCGWSADKSRMVHDRPCGWADKKRTICARCAALPIDEKMKLIMQQKMREGANACAAEVARHYAQLLTGSRPEQSPAIARIRGQGQDILRR